PWPTATGFAEVETAVVVEAFAIWKVRWMTGAALKLSLPACDAATVHEPAPVRCTVEPATEQLPVAANETISPDVAVALRPKSALPNVWSASAAKLMLWSVFAI